MAQIRTYTQPRSLYRYRTLLDNRQTLRTRETDNLEQGALWTSSFPALNDPMEGTFEIGAVSTTAPPLETAEALRQTKAEFGICSFSEVNDHELMWAHYADQFYGICIAYDFAKLLDALPQTCEFVRVSYDHKVLVVDPANRDTAKTILSHKSSGWLYEREWRLITPRHGVAKLQSRDCISCVYLGHRLTRERRPQADQLIAVLGGLGIPHCEMEICGYDVTFGTPQGGGTAPKPQASKGKEKPRRRVRK
jgi:hypothetical protein